MRDLEQQRADLQAQIYQTEADVAALASLDRTERIARDRLGMVPARVSQYVSVSVRSAVRGAAAAADRPAAAGANAAGRAAMVEAAHRGPAFAIRRQARKGEAK